MAKKKEKITQIVNYDKSGNIVRQQLSGDTSSGVTQTIQTPKREKVSPLVSVAKTVGNVVTNLGEGALKTGEGVLDTANTISDSINNFLQYGANKAVYGKEKADEQLKQSKKAQKDFVKEDLVKKFEDTTGYSDIKKDWEKGSLVKSENLGGQIAQGVGGMVPSLVAGQYMGFAPELKSVKGLSKLDKAKTIAGNVAKTYAGQLPANSLLSASAYGSGVQEALNKGATMEQAQKYGLANAAIEQGTEMLTGGVPGLSGKGSLDDIAEGVINKGAKGYGKATLKTLYRAGGEGLEEKVGTYLDALAKQGILGEKQNWKDVEKESNQAFLTGAAIGGILNSPQTLADVETARQENLANKLQTVQSLNEVERGALTGITQKIKAGEDLNIDDIATLQYLNSKSKQPTQTQMQPTQQNELNQVEATQSATQEPYSKQMTPEEVEEMNRIQTESLNRMAETEGYNKETPGEQLVQDNNVSDRKVKAVQYENPEIKPYYKDMAELIADEAHQGADMAYEGGLIQDDSGYGAPTYRRYGGWNGLLGEVDEFAKENHMTARQVEKAAQDIIEDNGKENNANAKKVEQLIDKRLRNGFTYMGDKFEPNQEYINEMEEIAYNKQRQQELDMLGDKKVQTNENIQKQPNEIEAKKETNDEYLRIDENGNSKMSDEIPQVLEKIPENKKKIDFGDAIDAAMQRLVNKGHNIDKVAKANEMPRLKTAYDRTLAASQEAQNQISKKQTNLNGKEYNNFKIKNKKTGEIETTTSSVNGIYEDAERSGIPSKILDEYAVNKLNLDRRKSGNEKWIEQFPNMTEEYSKNVIKGIENNYDDIKRVHGNLTQFYANLRQNMVDNGLMSKESKQYYDMNTPNFVHIQKDVGKRGSSASSMQTAKGVKINNQQRGIKGGNYDILPLRETTAQFTLDTLASMRKNIVGQQLGKLINPDADLEGTIIDFHNEDFNGGNTNELAKKVGNGEYTLTYYENGEAKTIPIDNGLYYAMTNPEISKGTKTLEDVNTKYGAGLLSRAQRGLLTDKNAFFIFTNFFKDIGDAPINSKNTKLFVKNYPSMVKDLSTKGAYSNLYENLGGKASSYFQDGHFVGETNPKNVVTKAIDKTSKAVNKALTPIEVANNFIEQLPRLTEFKSTIEANGYEVNENGDLVAKQGKNPTKSVEEVLDEAMYNAAEITTNFKRGGTWTKVANRNGATFLNASVQGFDKFIRNFTDVVDTNAGKPKINSKAAVKLMLKATIFGIAPSMLNDIMNGDDDDYKDLPEYQKDSYYLFKNPFNLLGDDHKWLRIPKGRMASIFGDAARRTRNAMKGEDKAFDGFLQTIENQIAPNSIVTNNVFSAFDAVKNNKAWSGNPIVSEWEQNEDNPEDEYDSKTDEFSKWLGKKLHKSPKKINYLLDQYGGVIGDIVLPLNTKYTNTPIDNKLGQALVAPMANKFTTSDIMSNKSQSEFYEEYNHAQNKNKHNKKYDIKSPKDKATNSYLINQNKKLAELKGEIEKVQSSDLSNKEKIKQVENLQDQINKLSKESVKNVKNIEKTDKEIKIGDSYFAIADGDVKKLKDETVQKAKDLGLQVGDYVEITTYKSNLRADKDANGKSIAGSAKQKFIDYVNAKNELTKQQKIAIIKKYYKKYE